MLDPNFDPVKNYFFKEIKIEKFEEIGSYFDEYFEKGIMNKSNLEEYFNKFKSLSKLSKNLENLKTKYLTK